VVRSSIVVLADIVLVFVGTWITIGFGAALILLGAALIYVGVQLCRSNGRAKILR
jgi:UPF0716 family protein affecting phage T7 exclusion